MDYAISNKMVSIKPSAIREIFKSLSDPTIIPFAAGNPSPESFPAEQLAALSQEIFANCASQALQYGITEGYFPLREKITSRIQAKFGIGGADDTLIITSGGQQGIDLTCKVLCNEGDVVICENPSFIGALNSFRANGAKLVGVDLESDGMNIDMLEEALKANPRAKLIYTIPTFHNPAGITTSPAKRKSIYALAKKYGVIILEDNPYGELRFSGEDIPTLKSMDEDGIVVYCSSFSKILSAGMRVGYLCAPTALMSKIIVAKQSNDVHTNLFFQMLCNAFMEKYDMDEHINGIKKLYGRKCGVMVAEMEKNIDERVSFTRPEGGLFLWCTLPGGVDFNGFIKTCMSNKIAVVPGTAFLCDETQPTLSFRLNYSTPSDEQIVKGIGILGDCIRQTLK